MAIFQRTLTVVNVTPVCDLSAYAAGDTLFDSTSLTGFTWDIDCPMELVSATILDEDDQTVQTMTIYFLDANVVFGTFNAAPSITDANARNILGFFDVEVTDWKDIGGSKIACLRDLSLILKPVAVGTNVYVAAVTGGTPTQTASGIKLRLGFAS